MDDGPVLKTLARGSPPRLPVVRNSNDGEKTKKQRVLLTLLNDDVHMSSRDFSEKIVILYYEKSP